MLLRYIFPFATVCIAGLTPHASAAEACLNELKVTPVGEMKIVFEDRETTLEFLSISVTDFAFGDLNQFTTGAYIREPSPENPNFHLWSLTAYPVGYGDALAASICGDDLLDIMDTYSLLADLGGLTGGALTGVSPALRGSRQLFKADISKRLDPDKLAQIEAGWAAIDAFEARLPDRTGTFHLNLRRERPDPAKILQRTDLTPNEMMALLENASATNSEASLDDPALVPCPCHLGALEAHVFNDSIAPPFGASWSWQSADQRNASFTAQLDIVKKIEGGYAISGSFEGALVSKRPDLNKIGLFGLPSIVTGDTFEPVSGTFTLDSAMAGGLARIPKLF